MARHQPARLLYADAEGKIYDHPRLLAAAEAGGRTAGLPVRELIALPAGSELFALPGRRPIGLDPDTGRPVVLRRMPGGRDAPRAVAAFVSPAYTRTRNPAFESAAEAPELPLFAYTAVAWHAGDFAAAAFRVDDDERQDFRHFEGQDLEAAVLAALAEFPDNSLVAQLATCVREYGCAAAKNFVLHRWECPLPTAPACNAACVGCVSEQPSGCCPAPQRRLTKTPTPDEIAEVATRHIARAERPVVSFGQGCEGEPLLVWQTLRDAIREIRERTELGTINLNSNASRPEAVKALAAAGLDAMRATMISPRKAAYDAYHRPRGYGLDDVLASIRAAREHGVHVSLNLLVFPGMTDCEDEVEALWGLLRDPGVDGIQLRNLNLDPERYRSAMGDAWPQGKPIGVRALAGRLRAEFPEVWLGYYNPALK